MNTLNGSYCAVPRTPDRSARSRLRACLAALLWSTVITAGVGICSNVRAEPAPVKQAHRSNKDIAKALFEEVWNKRNRAAIDQFFAAECIFKMGGSTKKENGPKWYQDAYDLLHPAFPDIHFTTEEPVSQGDRVAVYWRGDGTHGGPYMGKAATNKKIHVEGIIIFKFKDGKIVEFQEQWDALSLLQQIGVVNANLTTF
jgi:steroid delta-isomerase-like uncharacterized protein